MIYTYERNWCDCHPETCCCPKYNIMLGFKLIAKANSVESAVELCKHLNK